MYSWCAGTTQPITLKKFHVESLLPNYLIITSNHRTSDRAKTSEWLSCTLHAVLNWTNFTKWNNGREKVREGRGCERGEKYLIWFLMTTTCLRRSLRGKTWFLKLYEERKRIVAHIVVWVELVCLPATVCHSSPKTHLLYSCDSAVLFMSWDGKWKSSLSSSVRRCCQFATHTHTYTYTHILSRSQAPQTASMLASSLYCCY